MLLKIYPSNPQEKHIQKVVECLKDGGHYLSYGYGIWNSCDIFKQKAVEKLHASKMLVLKNTISLLSVQI